MPKIIAQIDPDLCDLIPGFLAHKRSDAFAILSGLESGRVDFEALRVIGHKLKGEGGSYGFDPITTYGEAIEEAARNRDAESIRRYAGELAVYLDSVQIEYA